MIRKQPAQRRHRVLVCIASALLVSVGVIGSANATITPRGDPSIAIAPATLLSANDVVVGALPASRQLHIVVSLNLRNKMQLDRHVASITNLHTPLAQRRMSRAQFAADYAPTQAQTNAVAQYLRAHGFNQIDIAPNRLLVSAYASADAVQTAFGTTLMQVHTASGESAYANTSSIHIPTPLQGVVQAVLGVQNVHHPRTLERHATTNSTSVTGHNPTEFPQIYAGDGLPSASTVTVGIITAGSLTQTITDLGTFTQNNGLPTVNTQVVTVGNGSNDTSNVQEWNLDSQAIVGMSGGVQKLVFYTADSMSFADLTAAMNAAVTDTTNNPKVINMSFGACEFNGSAAAAEDQVFQNAVAIGMTFAASSGDDGANCNKQGTFGVSDPASSPHLVAVGGTRLYTSGGNYVSESAWSGGGGGLSTFQPKPAWQTTVAGNYRGVPDIAFDADPSSGALVYVNGGLQQIGGTSLASPLFVGAWARLLAAHPELTFAAPYLYNTLTASNYHDVTTGNNATAQSGGNYSASTGFDLATGFGSFDMGLVSTDIGQPGPPGVSQIFNPINIAVGQTSTLTINISNGSQHTNAATLNADFTDNLPAGVTVAATPNASTTCNGTLNAVANATSITLPSGSSIAAHTACSITLDVNVAGTGTYTNTIAAGALKTSNGDNPYATTATLVVGNGLNTPIASFAPGRLDFTVASSGNANKTLTVTNTGGGTLTYGFAEADTTAQTHDTVSYVWDDGTSEGTDSLSNGSEEFEAVWLNRFPVAGPTTINTIAIYWPTQPSGTLVGKQPNLVAYFDADGDGNPSNAVRLGGDNLVTISAMGAFQNYSVNLQVPGAGDLYIGFADAWAANGSWLNLQPAAKDTDTPQDHSYIVYNNGASPPQPDLNDLSQVTDTQLLGYNLMIRASGTTSYSASKCDAPADVAWLSESQTSGSVVGGYSHDITVTADAASLADGYYTALLCATTNDTAHSKIQVPVSFTVGAANIPPTANFTVISNDLTANFSDASTDSDGSITAWSWDFGDGSAPSTAQNPSHTYAAAGTYNVSLTVTDNGGAPNTASHNVTVSNPPPPPTTPYVALAFSPTSMLVGANSTLTITVINPTANQARLTSTFRNNLPAGLTTVANTVATTCGGYNGATQTATRFTLPKYSTIPANGSCTMTGGVTAASPGTYINTLASNALKTNRGNNADPASATLEVTVNLPHALITPNALNFSVLLGGSDSGTLNIANTGNADLTWSIAEAAPQIRLGSAVNHGGTGPGALATQPSVLSVVPATLPLTSPAASPSVAPSDLSFVLDHGVYDALLGITNTAGTIEYASIFLNRFAPPANTPAYTINTISILWPSMSSGPPNALIGKQARLLAYYDADADGDPSNATYLGQSTVAIANLDVYTTYPVSFDVPGGGDIYVGFEDAWAEPGYTPTIYPAAQDTVYASSQRSYVYAMNDGTPPSLTNLANNTFGGTLDSTGQPGNLLIRASGDLQGGPTASCSNPSQVPWISEATASGTVTAGLDTHVTVNVNATGMAAGNYSALLCVSTNDPSHAMVEVPVGMTVTDCIGDGVTDRIFSNGFDGDACGVPQATIVTGNFNADVPDTFTGMAFDLVAGTHQPRNTSIVDDVNLYDADDSGSNLSSYWYGDVIATDVGGLVDGSTSVQVLHSGDSVGPGIAFSSNSGPLNQWTSGTNGYIGIVFWNEQTSTVNYGYIHLTTTAPLGFPAHVGDYAYNADGGPITIP